MLLSPANEGEDMSERYTGGLEAGAGKPHGRTVPNPWLPADRRESRSQVPPELPVGLWQYCRALSGREWVAQVPPEPPLPDASGPPGTPSRPQTALPIRSARIDLVRIRSLPLSWAWSKIEKLPIGEWIGHPAVQRLSRALEARSWLAVLACLAAVYLSINFVLPQALSASFNTYLVQPLTWLYITAHAALCWKYGLAERPAPNRSLVGMAALAGTFQVGASIIAGLFSGFGRSPFSHRPLALVGNAAYVGTMLLGIETSRACLVIALGRRRPGLGLAVSSVLLTLLSIPAAKLHMLDSPRSGVQFFGQILLPALSQNVLASYLAFIGGPTASAAYIVVLRAFSWLSPILPDLEWIVATFVGTLAPGIGLLIIHNQFADPPVDASADEPTGDRSTTAWALVAGLVVILIWFNTGLLGIRPSLIASNSMSPKLLVGDIALVRDVSPDNVAVGDIIRFRQGDVYVIHRVVDIQSNGNQITFVTRGDANTDPDPPVPEAALAGRVVLAVPKIGWVSVAARRLLDGGT